MTQRKLNWYGVIVSTIALAVAFNAAYRYNKLTDLLHHDIAVTHLLSFYNGAIAAKDCNEFSGELLLTCVKGKYEVPKSIKEVEK